MTAIPASVADQTRKLRVVAGARLGRVRIVPAVIMTLALILAFFTVIFSHARLTESSFQIDELRQAEQIERELRTKGLD